MSSASIDNKVEMYIGNTEKFELEVTDEDDAVVDITNAEIVFSVKTDFDSESFVFQRKNSFAGGGDTEILITDGPNGLAEIYVIPDNTKDLNKGTYVYDVWVKLTSGEEKTVVVNRLFLEDNVKKPE
jgi:hypothetical protein